MSKKAYRTDFLFPNSSFLTGAGSVFNIAGNYFGFNYSASDEQADSRALENDWGMIGEDILDVIKKNPPGEFALATTK
jgi:hypothetical protein